MLRKRDVEAAATMAGDGASEGADETGAAGDVTATLARLARQALALGWSRDTWLRITSEAWEIVTSSEEDQS